jgi:hypothetical protein
MPGPVPNRSDMRRRRNVEIPEPLENWHSIAKQWFVALTKSGERVFFENSDWAQAMYVAEAMSRSLSGARMSGQLFSAVISASAELLTTEGARRRMRVELERAHDEGDTTAADAMAEYRKTAGLKVV